MYCNYLDTFVVYSDDEEEEKKELEE